MHMALREKYIFHMLFGAFHITPRTEYAVLYIREEHFENQPKDFADVQDCCLQSGPVSDPFRFPL